MKMWTKLISVTVFYSRLTQTTCREAFFHINFGMLTNIEIYFLYKSQRFSFIRCNKTRTWIYFKWKINNKKKKVKGSDWHFSFWWKKTLYIALLYWKFNETTKFMCGKERRDFSFLIKLFINFFFYFHACGNLIFNKFSFLLLSVKMNFNFRFNFPFSNFSMG